MADGIIASIAVHGAPSTPSQQSALGFCAEWLASGHGIYRVFFYHDGVLVAGNSHSKASDDWTALSITHGFELAVCIGAAERRGIKSGSAEIPASPRFAFVGLGQLVDAIVKSDRFITFAA